MGEYRTLSTRSKTVVKVGCDYHLKHNNYERCHHVLGFSSLLQKWRFQGLINLSH
jgi:hypothetical protein